MMYFTHITRMVYLSYNLLRCSHLSIKQTKSKQLKYAGTWVDYAGTSYYLYQSDSIRLTTGVLLVYHNQRIILFLTE